MADHNDNSSMFFLAIAAVGAYFLFLKKDPAIAAGTPLGISTPTPTPGTTPNSTGTASTVIAPSSATPGPRDAKFLDIYSLLPLTGGVFSVGGNPYYALQIHGKPGAGVYMQGTHNGVPGAKYGPYGTLDSTGTLIYRNGFQGPDVGTWVLTISDDSGTIAVLNYTVTA